MLESLLNIDLVKIIESVGYLGIFAIIFAESGLLVGAILPGDSLLFTAGFLASQGFFNIWLLAPMTFIAAVLGDSVGYAFGHRVGKRLFQKEDNFFFHKKNLIRAKEFYDKHGGKTVTIARFLPIVRTFAPIVAGMGDMPYKRFLVYNLLGGFLWAVLIPFAGYFLGSAIPSIDRYLLPIIVVIVLISVAPTALHILLERRNEDKL
ncbi:MAG: VTT domain-containing protein, partial [Candidatus Curtissbacteria bacterium]|nr:VTT domain-containing protein [Candidatus Curtissbacteria bacterium]